jgi:hypothetical protein
MGDAADDAYDQYIEDLGYADALMHLTCNCTEGDPDWEEDDDGLLTCPACGVIIEL